MTGIFLVWNPARSLPKYQHSSRGSAVNEARRLALLYKGEKFIVLQSIGHAQVSEPVVWTEHDDGIPF